MDVCVSDSYLTGFWSQDSNSMNEPLLKVCLQCGIMNDKMNKCMVCLHKYGVISYFCSKSYQKLSWPAHKTAHSIYDSLIPTRQSGVKGPAKPSVAASGGPRSGIVGIAHSAGDNVEKDVNELNTFLISKVFEGNSLEVCKLLYFRADPMSTDCQGLTALNYAINRGHAKNCTYFD